MKIKSFFHCCFAAALILVPAFITAYADILPYSISEPVRVVTRAVEADLSVQSPNNFQIVPEADGAGIRLSFLSGENRKLACTLDFKSAGTFILWPEDANIPSALEAPGLLVVPGAPVPCDVLPVLEAGSERIFEVRREAGSRVFLDRIRVDCRAVTVEEARSSGWLNPDLPSPPLGLKMVSATNLRNNTFLVQQLWADDGTWWLYEETPYRRSWRMP